MEATARTNPADARNLITLGGAYYQMQQTNRAVELFHQALDVTNLSLADITTLAQCFAQLSDFPRLKVCLEKMTALVPKQPGPRYDLAALESVMGQAANSLQDLKLALQLNAALRVSEPTAPDLITNLPNDPRFNPVRSLPDFQKLLPAK
jgi:tetratricopeptide (TPR) repeat protein